MHSAVLRGTMHWHSPSIGTSTPQTSQPCTWPPSTNTPWAMLALFLAGPFFVRPCTAPCSTPSQHVLYPVSVLYIARMQGVLEPGWFASARVPCSIPYGVLCTADQGPIYRRPKCLSASPRSRQKPSMRCHSPRAYTRGRRSGAFVGRMIDGRRPLGHLRDP